MFWQKKKDPHALTQLTVVKKGALIFLHKLCNNKSDGCLFCPKKKKRNIKEIVFPIKSDISPLFSLTLAKKIPPSLTFRYSPFPRQFSSEAIFVPHVSDSQKRWGGRHNCSATIAKRLTRNVQFYVRPFSINYIASLSSNSTENNYESATYPSCSKCLIG